MYVGLYTVIGRLARNRVAARIVFATKPSSASVERVFSLLKTDVQFKEHLSSLADLVRRGRSWPTNALPVGMSWARAQNSPDRGASGRS